MHHNRLITLVRNTNKSRGNNTVILIIEMSRQQYNDADYFNRESKARLTTLQGTRTLSSHLVVYT